MITPRQLQTVGVRNVQQAAIACLHREADRGARRDGVHAEAIADLIQLLHRLDVVDEQIGAVQAGGFVLQPALLDPGVWPLLDLDGPTAADDAVATVVAASEDAVAHRRAGDLVGPFRPVVLLPVLDRPVAHLVVGRDAAGGAQRAKALRRADDLFTQILQVLVQAGLIGNREGARSAHGDRLEVLRAHDCAQSGTADGSPVLSVDHDRAETHQLLTSRADARHAGLLSAPSRAADLFAHLVMRLEGVLAPEMRGVAKLELTVVDPQVHGVIGTTADHQRVEAGLLQIVGPVAAAFGLAPNARQRTARAHPKAIGQGHGGARERARSPDHDVVRSERVGGKRALLPQQMGAEAGATQPAVRHLLRELSNAVCASRQIDVQDGAHITEWRHTRASVSLARELHLAVAQGHAQRQRVGVGGRLERQ